MTLQQRALEIAQSQIGQREKPAGSNWGEPVKTYLASVGINFPASWCMAFVYWCFKGATKKDSICPLVRTGGVLAAWNKADPKYKVVNSPQPGDIFIMDFGKGLGHTGIVEKVEGAYILTIEGNTNDTGSREGYEVARRKRLISKMKGFLRYTTEI